MRRIMGWNHTNLVIGGVAVCVGLSIVIATGQKLTQGGRGADEQETVAGESRRSEVSLERTRGSADSGKLSETEREARQREIEIAESVRLKGEFQGAAGGASILPRYPVDAQGIGRAILGLKPALRDCYENYGRRNQIQRDNIQVKVVIGPDPTDPSRGVVTNAESNEAAFRHPTVDGCVKNVVSDLRFDRPSHPIETELPLMLAHRN
jgi:hypothetical protein